MEEHDDAIRIFAKSDAPYTAANVKTQPHPGFPTDLQPQMLTLLSTAKGTSLVAENVWDNRFKYVGELNRMGVNVSVEGRIATVEGTPYLSGAPVSATDLRAGAALVIAGLMAHGVTDPSDTQTKSRKGGSIMKMLRKLFTAFLFVLLCICVFGGFTVPPDSGEGLVTVYCNDGRILYLPPDAAKDYSDSADWSEDFLEVTCDIWNTAGDNRLLTILEEEDVKATFLCWVTALKASPTAFGECNRLVWNSAATPTITRS